MAPSSIPHHRMVVDHCASSRCPPAVAAARIRGRRSVSPVPSAADKISIGLAPPVHGRPPVQAPASSLIPCLQNPADKKQHLCDIGSSDLPCVTPPIRDILCPYLLFPIDTQCSTQVGTQEELVESEGWPSCRSSLGRRPGERATANLFLSFPPSRCHWSGRQQSQGRNDDGGGAPYLLSRARRPRAVDSLLRGQDSLSIFRAKDYDATMEFY
uniref:Uncharacterized protein n=1 Tax=Oryza glumipatula TaxID=40148 RepID=A0A0D9ZEZ4_9ORYZ